jgi:hypothetical protein
MRRLLRTSGLMLAAIGVSLALAAATARAGEKGGFGSASPARVSSGPSYVTPYFFPSFGGFGGYGFYGGYYSPFIDFSTMHSTHPYLPKYWWAERYPSADPRQAGYNPNSGYPREEVTTLLLVTYPVKTRVILDGIFVGTSDNLGPIQLPLGMHTLRVEALGFEPSQTVMNIEEPTLQQLEVRLSPKARATTEAGE